MFQYIPFRFVIVIIIYPSAAYLPDQLLEKNSRSSDSNYVYTHIQTFHQANSLTWICCCNIISPRKFRNRDDFKTLSCNNNNNNLVLCTVTISNVYNIRTAKKFENLQ